MSVETVIVLPVLILLAALMVVLWDGYRREAMATKATYMVGDLISRRDTAIGQRDVEGLAYLFGYVTRTGAAESWMRVTEVWRDGDDWRIEWSRATGGRLPLGPSGLGRVSPSLPPVEDKERLVLVQTFLPRNATMTALFGGATSEALAVTRQRYSDSLAWDEGRSPICLWGDPDWGPGGENFAACTAMQ